MNGYRLYRNMMKETKETHEVCIELYQYPLWLLPLIILEQWIDGICGLLHEVPLPKWLVEYPYTDKEDPEWWGSIGDYYGEEWGGLWHCYIECPITETVFKHTQTTIEHINVPLSAFGDNHEVDWIRGDIEREAKVEEWHWQHYPGDSWLFKFLEWATRPWRNDSTQSTKESGTNAG